MGSFTVNFPCFVFLRNIILAFPVGFHLFLRNTWMDLVFLLLLSLTTKHFR